MRKFLSLGLVCLLAACAGGGVRTWDGTLRQMQGKPINDATIVYGEPDRQYQKGDTVTYVWQDRKADSVFGPAVTAGRGYRLGSPMNDGHEFLWSGIEYYRCVIRAETRGGIITRIWSEGDPGGCEVIHGFRKMPLGKNPSGPASSGF